MGRVMFLGRRRIGILPILGGLELLAFGHLARHFAVRGRVIRCEPSLAARPC